MTNSDSEQRQEIELKYAVANQEALDKFAAFVVSMQPAAGSSARTLQVNHFFDSEDLRLRRQRLLLRLRDEEGTIYVTAKGRLSGRKAQGALSARAEDEVVIATKVAKSILAGGDSPLVALKLGMDCVSPLVQAIEATLSGVELRRVGSFQNERTRLGPLALGGSEVLFELDHSSFPGGAEGYEIEVEAASAAAAQQIAQRVEQWLEQAGVEWQTTTSKSSRFFEALTRPG